MSGVANDNEQLSRKVTGCVATLLQMDGEGREGQERAKDDWCLDSELKAPICTYVLCAARDLRRYGGGKTPLFCKPENLCLRSLVLISDNNGVI